MSTTTFGNAERSALATDSNPVALALGEHLSRWLASRPPADAQDDETTPSSLVHPAATPLPLTPLQAAQNQEQHSMAHAAKTAQASTLSEAVADTANASDGASGSEAARLAADIDRRLSVWEVAGKWQREADAIEPGEAGPLTQIEAPQQRTAPLAAAPNTMPACTIRDGEVAAGTSETTTTNTTGAIKTNDATNGHTAQASSRMPAPARANAVHAANADELALAQALADDLDDRLSKWSTWISDVEAVEAAKTLNAAADGIAAQAASSLEAKSAPPRHGTTSSTSLCATAVPRTPSALAAMLELLRELYNAIVALVRWVARKLGLGARSLAEAAPATQAAPQLHANHAAHNTANQPTTALTHLEDETQAARQQAHDAVAAVKAALHDKPTQAFSAQQQQELIQLRCLVNEALRKLEVALGSVEQKLKTTTNESTPYPQLVEYRGLLLREIQFLRAIQGAMSLWPTDKATAALQQAQATQAAQASNGLPSVAAQPQRLHSPQCKPAQPDAKREVRQPAEQSTTPAAAQADRARADAVKVNAVTDGPHAAEQGMDRALYNLHSNMRTAPALAKEQTLVASPGQMLADHTDAAEEHPAKEASRPRMR